jgi:hypothetical protein
MSSGKIISLTFSLIFVIIAIFLSAKPVSVPTPGKTIRTHPSPVPLARSVLTFTPATLRLTGLEEHQLMLTVSTGVNRISSAQLEIKYDSDKIIIKSIYSGGFFPKATSPVNDPTRRRGRIDYVLTLPEGQTEVSGSGKLAVITFMRNPAATESAVTRIELLPKTSLRGNGQSASLLQSTGSATLILTPMTPLIPSQ